MRLCTAMSVVGTERRFATIEGRNHFVYRLRQLELRIGARPGHRPHVDNEADTGLLQEIDKFDDRPGRVTYGEKSVRVSSLQAARDQPASL